MRTLEGFHEKKEIVRFSFSNNYYPPDDNEEQERN